MNNYYDLNDSDNKSSDELIGEAKKATGDLEKTDSENESEKHSLTEYSIETKADSSYENYYDFNFIDVPRVHNDESLNKSVDLSKKIQDGGESDQSFSNENNFSNNYNGQYQNNQNMNYNPNPYDSSRLNPNPNPNPYTNYNNQYNQNKMYNNNINYSNYQSVQSKNISRTPVVLGVLSGISGLLSLFGSVIALVYKIVSKSITIEPETLFDDPYTRAMLLSIIPVWVFACIIGIAAIVFAVISTRYVKAATIGFLICTILFLLLAFPGYGGTFISFVLSLIATIISYGNMKRFTNS